jgi:cytochrome c biogenesis protein CcdA
MLTILGLIVIVLATFYIYRLAKKNGRNAVTWAAITVTVGGNIQILIPFLLVMIIFFVLTFAGNSVNKTERLLKTPIIIIDTICLIFTIISLLLIMRFVAKTSEEKTFTIPPSPPEFN